MIGNWGTAWAGAPRNLVRGGALLHLDASNVHTVVQLGKNSWCCGLKADACHTSCPMHLTLQFLKTFKMQRIIIILKKHDELAGRELQLEAEVVQAPGRTTAPGAGAPEEEGVGTPLPAPFAMTTGGQST